MAVLCAVCTTAIIAQPGVTAAAAKTFRQMFPKASGVKWEKENSREYEAGFLLDGRKMSANFSATGEWLETETPIEISSAPAVVMDGFTKSNPKAIVKQVYRIESKTQKYFEVEYTINGRKKELKIAADGKTM